MREKRWTNEVVVAKEEKKKEEEDIEGKWDAYLRN